MFSFIICSSAFYRARRARDSRGVTNRWKIEKVNNLKSRMYFPIAIHVFVFDHLSQGNQNSGPILILIFLLILVNREPLGEKQIHETNGFILVTDLGLFFKLVFLDFFV